MIGTRAFMGDLGLPSELPNGHLARVDRAVLAACVTILATYLVEAPIRFGLMFVHAEMAIYSRDLLMLLTICLSVATNFRTESSVIVFALIGLLFLHFLVGIASLSSHWQPVAGAKIFLPVVFGVAIAPTVRRHFDLCMTFAEWSFAITVFGLLCNWYWEFPWSGMSYDTALVTVEVSRSWAYEGVPRLAGFTRASSVASGAVLLTLVPALSRRPRLASKVVLTLIAAFAITLTTTRGGWTGLLAFIAFEVLWIVPGPAFWALGLVLLSSACLLLPLIAVRNGVSGSAVPNWQLSFVERIQDMWPRALALLSDPFQMVWGRGLGGIGMAQRIGEPDLFNAADNLMIYVLVTFGIAGIFYVGVFVARALRYVSTNRGNLPVASIRGWLVIWFAVGFTTNMIEDMLTEIVVGLTMGLVFVSDQTEDRSRTRDVAVPLGLSARSHE